MPASPRKHLFLELLLYGIVPVLGVAPALVSSGTVVGDGVDLYGTLWFYWWIGDCLTHLRDPGFTDLFFHPLGKDIFAHTGNNFIDALVSLPFQALLGFPRYEPVFVAFVLWGNAIAFRPLARRLAHRAGEATPPRRWWRNLFGGPALPLPVVGCVLLWQTSPYILFEVTCGRITQAFLWFLPLAVERFLSLEEPETSLGAAVAAGLFTALQAWTYWYMGHFMAVLFAWMAVVALLRPRIPRARLAIRWFGAGTVAWGAVAPAVVLMFHKAGGGQVPGLAEGGGGLLALPRALGNNVHHNLHGYWLMERWGAPMLGYGAWLAVIAVVVLWSRNRLRWLGGGLLLLLLAFGPVIPAGRDETVRNFPYLLAYHLVPFLDRFWFPYRIVGLVFFCLCAALVTATVRPAPVRRRRLLPIGVLLLVALSLVGQHRNAIYPFVTRDVTIPHVIRWIGTQGGGLVHVPIGINQPAIVWQVHHRQPLFGGMGENAPLLWPGGYRERLRIPLVRALRLLPRSPSTQVELPSENPAQPLLSDGFRWVVLHRDLVEGLLRRANPKLTDEEIASRHRPRRVVARMTGILGDPVAVDGALVVWDLQGTASPPAALRPTGSDLESRDWKQEQPPLYEQRLRERGRLPRGGVPDPGS